jgi:dihydrofolate reductase
MGRIVLSTNVTLDGVVEDPDGQEGFARGGWFNRSLGAAREEWATLLTDEALRSAALLIGRRSDEWFAARWPATRTGPWAERLYAMPKYVVASKPAEPVWSNATSIDSGDVVREVRRLRAELDGDIVVYASYQLVRTLLEHDLVDGLHLMVFPVVLGAGRRLFEENSDETRLRLVAARTLADGLVFLDYQVVR